LRRAALGDADALPRLADLHDRLLKLGVARQLARAPEGARAAASDRVAADLARAADETGGAAAALPPAVGELVQPFVVSCRETAGALRAGKVPPAPADWPAAPAPLEAVAARTLQLANADDPL